MISLRNLLAWRYQQPTRYYHTMRHIYEMLANLQPAAMSVGLSAEQTRRLCAAIWFHDAIMGMDGERRSADLAAAELHRAGYEVSFVDDVQRLVVVTAGHEPKELDEQVMCDLDQMILAASSARYIEYVGGVRDEYGLPDLVFAKGRREFLETRLARSRIFHIFDGLEDAARSNMEYELDGGRWLWSGID